MGSALRPYREPADISNLFTAHDSFYGESRVFEIDTDTPGPAATIVRQWPIRDSSGFLRFGLERTKAVCLAPTTSTWIASSTPTAP